MKSINFKSLVAVGIPIYTETTKIKLIKNKIKIKKIIRELCVYLNQDSEPRLRLALESWFLALKRDFPTTHKNLFHSKIYQKYFPRKITGPHIKLKRLAADFLVKML